MKLSEDLYFLVEIFIMTLENFCNIYYLCIYVFMCKQLNSNFKKPLSSYCKFEKLIKIRVRFPFQQLNVFFAKGKKKLAF